MAKKSMIEREKKRQKLVEKYAEKRETLKEEFENAPSQREKLEAHRKLQQLPRNSAQPSAEPLLGDRASSWLLPGLRTISPCAAGMGAQRSTARGCKIQLVEVRRLIGTAGCRLPG
jgi:hypothetical protein